MAESVAFGALSTSLMRNPHTHVNIEAPYQSSKFSADLLVHRVIRFAFTRKRAGKAIKTDRPANHVFSSNLPPSVWVLHRGWSGMRLAKDSSWPEGSRR